MLMIGNLLGLMLSIAWLARSPDWEPAILSISLFVALVTQELNRKKQIIIPNNTDENEEYQQCNERQKIIKNYKPSLYLPLESNFCSTSKYPSCETNIFPHIFIQGETFDNNLFIKNMGYKFNGKNLISVHSQDNFPSGKEARTFIMAVRPTNRPTKNKPMFFFSYGQRKSHKCADGINNHDKSFGLFWGEPQPDESIEKKFKGMGIRVFFYCEHCKKDRISQNCDTQSLYEIETLNKWYILAVSYNGDSIQVYVDGVQIHNKKYDISTSNTPYLNIGGFVHHDKNGAMIAKDLEYTMNGYIREFIMIREHLSDNKISDITNSIKLILEDNHNKSLERNI